MTPLISRLCWCHRFGVGGVLAVTVGLPMLPFGSPGARADGPIPAPPTNPLLETQERFHPIPSSGGIVAAQDGWAATAGARQLRAGGNAVDGAVATAFALAVTHPQAGNLGGGGFLVLWLPGASPATTRGCLQPHGPSPERTIGRGTAVAINFREQAPQAASPGLFLKADGTVDRQRATRSVLSTGVPGTVAGLVLAQRCYGRLPLAQVLAPAIALAEGGFPVSVALSRSLAQAAPQLQADATARTLFFRPGPASLSPAGTALLTPPRPGELLRQPLLARTLRRIAALGAPGFYEGPVAQALTDLMAQRGGLITAADLRAYRAQLVAPLQRPFRGHTLLTMPPPGGGLTLLQLLALLEPFPLDATGPNSARSIHLFVEASNLAYRDRNDLLGDPAQIAIPAQQLLGEPYLDALRRQISADRHRPPASLSPRPPFGEGTNTTHLSVADRQGGLVALTTTLNFPYGNGIAVPGAGFLLNNEMDDFTASPGSPNAFGLVQGQANAIAPGRRPLSSMAPTLVFRPDGRPWIATGSPGGSRIITTLAQVLLHRLVHGRNLATSVAAPRVHSQLWPDVLSHEEGISPDTLLLLQGMGHTLRQVPAMGAAHSVEVREQGGSEAAVDPRRPDGAAVAE
ncbi:MAG: gamma-glutamyltransferase [Cyanobacteriota bacterium]|nr:gamma-glutamyltransferase [Cyanobacteriota bacterium]